MNTIIVVKLKAIMYPFRAIISFGERGKDSSYIKRRCLTHNSYNHTESLISTRISTDEDMRWFSSRILCDDDYYLASRKKDLL